MCLFIVYLANIYINLFFIFANKHWEKLNPIFLHFLALLPNRHTFSGVYYDICVKKIPNGSHCGFAKINNSTETDATCDNSSQVNRKVPIKK